MADDVRFEHREFERLTPIEVHAVLKLRSDVFLVEQGITAEPDLDGRDPEALHVLGRAADGSLVATARVEVSRRPVKVSRVAVHPTRRSAGVGSALMHLVHELLGDRDAELSAQDHLVAWYEALGWRAVGGTYDEAGVPHRRMVRGDVP